MVINRNFYSAVLNNLLFRKPFEILIPIIFSLVSVLFGQVYVSPDGNDTNPGTIDRPFKIIKAGITAIGNTGGLVYVRAGIYSLDSTLKLGSSGLPTS